MTVEAVPLSAEILGAFRDAMAGQGALLAAELGPGLDASQIAALGFEAPQELVTLLSWGTAPENPTRPGSLELTPEFALLPVTKLHEETRAARALSPIPAGSIAFARSGSGWLMIDTEARDEVSPVIYYVDSGRHAAAPSLGALFVYWTEQIETGESEFEDGRWWADDDARAAWIRETD